MDDAQRQPGRSDRDRLARRIRDAADQGWITPADRDIRLSNVSSAVSMSELSITARDLDQLQATFAGASRPVSFPAAPGSVTPSPVEERTPGSRGRGGTGIAVVIAVVVVLVGLGGVGLFALSGGSEGSVTTGPGFPGPEDLEPAEEVEQPDLQEFPTPVSGYELTGPGIRGFLTTYREEFGTSRVLDLTLYDDYAIARVPVAGKKGRYRGWLLRPDTGWREFGPPGSSPPGTRPVDLAKLDVKALVANIARARRTLGVEDVSTTYAIIRWTASFDERPGVDIHVSNEFRESGYLATFLDGRVERAYPFRP